MTTTTFTRGKWLWSLGGGCCIRRWMRTFQFVQTVDVLLFFFFWGSWGGTIWARVIFSWRSQIVFFSFRRQQGKAEAVRASGQQITFIRCHRDKSYSSWRRMFNNKKKRKERGSDRPSALQQQRRRRRYTNAIESEKKKFPLLGCSVSTCSGKFMGRLQNGSAFGPVGLLLPPPLRPNKTHTQNINQLNSFLCYVMGGQSPYKMTIPNYKFSSVFSPASSCTSL